VLQSKAEAENHSPQGPVSIRSDLTGARCGAVEAEEGVAPKESQISDDSEKEGGELAALLVVLLIVAVLILPPLIAVWAWGALCPGRVDHNPSTEVRTSQPCHCMTPRHPTDSPEGLRRGIALGLVLVALLLLLSLGSYSWLLRDGLGPDAVESSGFEALRRFWSDFWPVAAICGIICLAAFFVWPKRRRSK
jgi:hypothetical protein